MAIEFPKNQVIEVFNAELRQYWTTEKMFMKLKFNLLLIALINLLIMSCQNTDNQQVNTMDEGTHLKRNTILVADIDRSLTIYRDILGFTVENIKDSDDDSYSYPVFKIPNEAKIRFCTLNSPDQIRTMALTEVKGIDLPRPVIPHMNSNVIRVKNLPGVMEKVKELGLEHTKLKKDTNHTGLSFYEQSFVDYDGHLVVIYEITND